MAVCCEPAVAVMFPDVFLSGAAQSHRFTMTTCDMAACERFRAPYTQKRGPPRREARVFAVDASGCRCVSLKRHLGLAAGTSD